MKENPDKYRELFKVFQILLIDGIIDAKFINNWADKILAKEVESEYEFIEISTTCNLNDLVTLLNNKSEKCNLKIVQRAVFGILYNFNFTENVKIETAARIVGKFVYCNNLTKNEEEVLYNIDDYIELAISRVYGDFEKLKNEFWDFLEIYSELNFDTYENWYDINQKLEKELIKNIQKILDKYSIKE